MDSHVQDYDVVIDAAREKRREKRIENTINRVCKVLLSDKITKEILHSPCKKKLNKKSKNKLLNLSWKTL